MMRRVLIGFFCAALIVCAGLYVTGKPGAAHAVWRDHQAALRNRNYLEAATFVDRHLLQFENRQRLRAIAASETELLALSPVELASVLGIRAAVRAGARDAELVRHPPSPPVFHAALRKSTPHDPLIEPALLFVVPLGPNRSVGWIGPRQYAGSMTALTFSMVYGMRINFSRSNGAWRLDYLPAMSASARENERLMSGGTTGQSIEARKRVFNTILAANDAKKQTALWRPLGAEPAAPTKPE